MKTILIFVNGELLRQINYPTKRAAREQYCFFKKMGYLDADTGEVIQNAIFELL